MPFNQLGFNATLMDFARERANDAATVAALETGKRQGRQRNFGAAVRAVPSSHSDVIQGDAVGDFLNDGTHEYELKLMNDGTLKWNKHTLNVSW